MINRRMGWSRVGRREASQPFWAPLLRTPLRRALKPCADPKNGPSASAAMKSTPSLRLSPVAPTLLRICSHAEQATPRTHSHEDRCNLDRTARSSAPRHPCREPRLGTSAEPTVGGRGVRKMGQKSADGVDRRFGWNRPHRAQTWTDIGYTGTMFCGEAWPTHNANSGPAASSVKPMSAKCGANVPGRNCPNLVHVGPK